MKQLIADYGVSQRELAAAVGISPAAMNDIVNRGRWPRKGDKAALQTAIEQTLATKGVPVEGLWAKGNKKTQATREEMMLLRKQNIFQQTRKHFGLLANPFGEVGSHEDVYLSADYRYVREAMYHTARHGGFIAVVGESGSGKSTLRRDLIARLGNEGQMVHIMEPYVLGLEDNDKHGKTLKAIHIAEAIMAQIAPTDRLKQSSEGRFRQLHHKLRESHRTGGRHCLVIEEAHALPTATIKHLKRFLELEDGFAKLISIILLGQPELKHRLSGASPQVREVVQRCEVIEICPMTNCLPDYLRFRFERVGADYNNIFTPEAVTALQDKLTGPASRSGRAGSLSLVYPLAVGNLATAAMNLAANIGAPTVTPEIINQV